MKLSPLRLAGRLLRRAGNELLNQASIKEVWIDVGAHLGETTLTYAAHNPGLTIYAFEPNWELAAHLMGKLANFIVLPMAVSDRDGFAQFFLNVDDSTSSLLPLDPIGLANWKGGDSLHVEKNALVPTIRLDTFMQSVGIQRVDYLKIDAQGADFMAVRSAGSRLKDIYKITLEVDITPTRLYNGSASRDEIFAYMAQHGFTLTRAETQSFGQEENLTFVLNGSGPGL